MMKLNASISFNSILLTVISAELFASAFCHVCLTYISPMFAYVGFAFVYDLADLCKYLLIAFVMSLQICFQRNNARKFYITMIYIFSVIPFLFLYFFSERYSQYHEFFWLGIIAYTIIFIVTIIPARIHFVLFRDTLVYKSDLLLVLLTVLTLFIIARYIFFNGLGMFNLNLYNVYAFRRAVEHAMPGILGYVATWVSKIFNPLCVILCFHYKRYKALLFFVALQIILFGVNSHKSTLFTAVFLIGFYVCAKPFIQKAYLAICAATFGLYVPIIFNSPFLLSMIRRIFLVPAQLNYYYFDYFSKNGFDWFKRSFLRHFVTSQYDMPLPYIIGREMFNSPEMSANTGFLGAGYANGGLLIVFVYSLIIGVAINIISSYSRMISPRIALGVTFVPLIFGAVLSSDLPTTFLTGGLFLSFILLSILIRCKDREKMK